MIDVDGEVYEPGSPGYDDARRPADVRFAHVRPRLVVRCGSEADVVRAVAHARSTGMPLVPRGGGHCFAGRSSTEGIVLDLGGLDGVSLAAGGVATIGAGARLAGVYDALHRHGRTLPAGCGPTVGIAGLTLGGGIGLLGRRYGLTCDRLVAARVVLADGRVVDCSAESEPDLFWALRGAGGGQFGVVTSLDFATVAEPATTLVAVGKPRAPLADVVEAWQDWAPDAPDELTVDLSVLATPGRPVEVAIGGASLLAEAPTRELLDGFRAAVGADLELRGGVPYSGLKAGLAGRDPLDDVAEGRRIRSEFFTRPLRRTTIDALCAALDLGLRDGDGPRRLAFAAMGGAYDRVPAGATAFAHRGQRFLLEHGAAVSSAWPDVSWAIAHGDGSGRVYPNFPDPELGDDAPLAYHGENLPRLAAVKRRYDPDRMFTFPHSP
ncbi:FAD-binding oxidoreductase [Jiangella mangrovi]|uniref:FAD/FMN-containing dehydrogenase n=1 Tax=Jiangella mangrovi TaxID=1524084 RepID=A0A7W9GKZ7_9ACTN|nr:FAD-binding oxidoreductase [Jiangella mangrovi]MBB5785763.1 FAD/FMN-containing dehydrogenase [Jiangella mangrovi]